MSNIESCGPSARASVQRAFQSLYSHFASLLATDKELVPAVKALMLDAWAIDFVPFDHAFLVRTDILSTLQSIAHEIESKHAKARVSNSMIGSSAVSAPGKASFTEIDRNSELLVSGEYNALDAAVAQLARVVHKLIAMACVDFEVEAAASAASPTTSLTILSADQKSASLDSLQRNVLHSWYEQLLLRAGQLSPVRLVTSRPSTPLALQSTLSPNLYLLSFFRCSDQIKALGLSDVELEKGATELAQAYLDIESSIFHILSLFVTVSNSAGVLHWLAAVPRVCQWLKLFRTGSPRIQRLSVRLLGLVLPRFFTPEQFEANRLLPALFDDEQPQRSRPDSFVEYLFVELGRSLASQESAANEKEKESKTKPTDASAPTSTPPAASASPAALDVCPYDYRNGEVALNHASELVSFIRLLLIASPEAWGPVIRSYILRSLKALPQLAAALATDDSKAASSAPTAAATAAPVVSAANTELMCALASLSVIGGHVENYRIGGRVQTSVNTGVAAGGVADAGAVVAVVGAAGAAAAAASASPSAASASSVSSAGGNSAAPASAVAPAGGAAPLYECGRIVFLDRSSGKARVLLDSQQNRVIEVELSKLLPIPLVAPVADLGLNADGKEVSLAEDVLRVFQLFTSSLNEEALDSEQQKAAAATAAAAAAAAAEQEKQAQKEREEQERKKKAEEAAKPKPKLEDWACGTCTYVNVAARRVCEVCNEPNPNFVAPTATAKPTPAAAPAAAKPKAAASAKKEEPPKPHISSQRLFYHQLRSRALKALCHVIQQPTFTVSSGSLTSPSLLLRSQSSNTSMLPTLVAMAVRPTSSQGFKSVDLLERTEDRLIELLRQAERGMADDVARFQEQHRGVELTHSPFAGAPVLLPNTLDVGSARAATFVAKRPCDVVCTPTKDASVSIVRANNLIPNSLPSYYVSASSPFPPLLPLCLICVAVFVAV
jgi:hypothetical protein